MFDGGSRGNPGPAGCGALLLDGSRGQLLGTVSHFMGQGTNNEAEYRAALIGIRAAAEIDREVGIGSLFIEGDSQLVIKQLTGEYEVKSANLVPLHAQIQKLLSRFKGRFSLRHILRAENSKADELANQAMDRGTTMVSMLWKRDLQAPKPPAAAGEEALASLATRDDLTKTQINKMRVDELRSELNQRGLPSDGRAPELRQRLKALIAMRGS
mmetsp:Transcript_18128/g.60663  ORF Transcript_18128/g.60663 Transcript_18128/m.60663 type:complete len:213 (+) Transcript_18128:272-910(+)